MSLTDPLAKLEQLLERVSVTPLTGQAYTRAHAVFEAASNQRDHIREFLLNAVDEIATSKGRPINVCSAGCGDGGLDLPTLRSAREQISNYVGFDPSASQLSAFEGSVRPSDLVELVQTGDPTDLAGRCFDLVHSIHVTYYVDDLRAFVEGLRKLAGADGTGIVGVAPLGVMNRIADAFWREGGKPIVYSRDFGERLSEWKVAATRERIESALPLRDVSGPDRNQDIVDFTVQAMTAGLGTEIQTMLDEVFQLASVTRDGVAFIPHPVDMWSFSGI